MGPEPAVDHDHNWPPHAGAWVIWVMPSFVKVGQVVYVKSKSAVIHFQAHPEPTVLPDAHMYWNAQADAWRAATGGLPEYTLTWTEEPRHKLEAADGQTVTVRQAAALMGVGPKDVRRMLRAGQLEGRREGGSWVEVDRDSLRRRREAAQDDTD